MDTILCKDRKKIDLKTSVKILQTMQILYNVECSSVRLLIAEAKVTAE